MLEDNCEDFCRHLVGYLRERSDTTRAILQAGACERKAEGLLQAAMDSWLARHAPQLLCLTEHNRVDFAWVPRESVGRDFMDVDVVFEVKFNYAAQRDIEHRPGHTRVQLANYQSVFLGASTYFLYFVIDLARPSPGGGDLGWRYAKGFNPIRLEERIEIMQNASTQAGFELLRTEEVVIEEWQLHLSLFKLPAITAEREAEECTA